MRAPSTADLLNMWEKGLHQGSVSRALTLLEALYPEGEPEALAQLSIGERDARLFQLRQVLFGPRMTSTTRCPRCSERLEWESDVADLLVHRVSPPAGFSNRLQGNGDPSPPKRGGLILDVTVESCRIKFRLPNSGDLPSLSGQRDAAVMREQLLERCLIEASTKDGEPLQFGQLPETALQGMIQEMERADPQSNPQICLTCPACGHCWEAAFDIVSFLWSEIHSWAQRTLRTVHLLARSYGWQEADILAMSPTRRQIYLEMARQ
jgi:hypothetical protein